MPIGASGGESEATGVGGTAANDWVATTTPAMPSSNCPSVLFRLIAFGGRTLDIAVGPPLNSYPLTQPPLGRPCQRLHPDLTIAGEVRNEPSWVQVACS